MWIILACMSAVFAGITSILAKCGIKNTDSDIATAIRTAVVLVFSWIMVFIVGSVDTASQISAKSLLFIILSGLATGASWICYFKALSIGDVNKVVPIDKSSTILTVLFAVVILNETNNLAVKLICTSLLAVGTYLMIESKKSDKSNQKQGWMIFAVLSAIFAALTSILAKIGIEGVESNLATALRTCVVLVMAWLIVSAKGKIKLLHNQNRHDLIFIVLSGFATGASWLCYYKAIQDGLVSVVVPIDKLSILISVAFSTIILKEKLSVKSAFGLFLITVGTLGMAVFP